MSQKTILTGAGVALVAYLYLKSEVKAGAESVGSAVGSAASAVGSAVNPIDEDNLINQGVNGLGGWLTENDNFKLGGWIYDQFNNGTGG